MANTFRLCYMVLPHVLGSHQTVLDISCSSRCGVNIAASGNKLGSIN
jgi:hypothetical protein